MEPAAKIIADSVNEFGDRLTTMEVRFHRFVLAEINTHRAFSRNSASSRAIPVEKQIQRVLESPAIPVSFPAEQRGMQGGQELEVSFRESAKACWLIARDEAVRNAKTLAALGVHKSVVNRLLEPFMWHTAIITSTQWGNFFSQRATRYSELAQPELRACADLMLEQYEASTPVQLAAYQWHMPYVEARDLRDCEACGEDPKKVSAARCARVSYLTHDGNIDVQQDVELYYKLISARPMHASPLEHVARPELLKTSRPKNNFVGWAQLRQLVEGDAGIDSRR